MSCTKQYKVSEGADMSFVTRLGVARPDDLTAHDGGDKRLNPDYLAAYVASTAEAQCHYELETLAAMDNAIRILLPPTGMPTVYTLGMYNKLMALRHEYLDEVLYSAMHEAAGEALLRPRLLLSTVSFLQKLQGNLSTWSRPLKSRKQLLLVVDEFHQCSMEGLLAVLPSFDCAVLAGDTEQAPPKDWLTAHEHRLAQAEQERHYRRLPVLSEPGSTAEADDEQVLNPFPDIRSGYRTGQPPAPLRKHLATDWLSTHVAQFDLKQTYRCGPSVVYCLQTMCPQSLGQRDICQDYGHADLPFRLLFS